MKAGIYREVDAQQSMTERVIYVRKDRSIAYDTHWNPNSIGRRGSVRTFDKEQTVVDDLYGIEFTRVSDVPNGCTSPQDVVNVYLRTGRKPQRNESVIDMPGEQAARQEAYLREQEANDRTPEAKMARIAESCGEGAKSFIERAEDQNISPTGRIMTPRGVLGHVGHGKMALTAVLTKLGSAGFDDTVKVSQEADYSSLENRVLSWGADDADFSLAVPFDYRAEGYRRCHKQSARKHRKRGDHVIRDGEGGYMWRPRA